MPPTATSEATRKADQSKPLGALATTRRAIFWVSLPFGILHFVLPIFGREVGANALEIGWFFSAFSLMVVLLRPAVGWALDRFGRRGFFVGGLLGYALTMFAFATSLDVRSVVVARIAQGASSALLWLAARSTVADVADATQRGSAFGRVDQASMSGSVLGTLIGFIVLSSMSFLDGWRGLFIVYGMASLAAALMAWRGLPETSPQDPHLSQPIRWSRDWTLLLLVTMVTGASAAMLAPIMMVFLQGRFGTDIVALGWAYLPAALVQALFQGRIGRLADRLGRKPLMVTSMGVAAISSVLIPRLTSLMQLSALWAVQAVCYAGGDPAEQALVAGLTGSDQRGRAYGLYTFAAGLGATVGPIAGGWLYKAMGPEAPFCANGAVLGGCALVLFVLLQGSSSIQ